MRDEDAALQPVHSALCVKQLGNSSSAQRGVRGGKVKVFQSIISQSTVNPNHQRNTMQQGAQCENYES